MNILCYLNFKSQTVVEWILHNKDKKNILIWHVVSLFIVLNLSTFGKTGPCFYHLFFNILDPCIESNVRSLDHQESRSLHCGYKKSDENCDNDMTSGWYKSESTMVTQCPGLLACGSIYPVWLNGSFSKFAQRFQHVKTCIM